MIKKILKKRMHLILNWKYSLFIGNIQFNCSFIEEVKLSLDLKILHICHEILAQIAETISNF